VMYDRGPRCGLEENYGYYLPKNRIVGKVQNSVYLDRYPR
jgi:hypothetical protein